MSKTTGKKAASRKSAQAGKSSASSSGKKRGSAGPVAFFVALFIVALGSIQLISTFHTYAMNLSELNGLKRQESALIVKKQNLENDIARWNDNAYVTAQARERLGFVFPGEQAIRVEHPEAVTGTTQNDTEKTKESSQQTLPWYSELSYSFQQADKPVTTKSQASARSKNESSSKQGASSNDTTGDATTDTTTDSSSDTQ